MKPLSPSPWFVGGSRTTDERTPREARSRVICALRARIAGPPVKSVAAASRSGMSRSVARRPGATPSVPEACARETSMSVAVITVAGMSVSVINYDSRMTRWEPDARGRLELAALALYGDDRDRDVELVRATIE